MCKAYFNSTRSDLVKYNGRIVNVGRALTSPEIDIEDVGPMFEVTLSDGKQIKAFLDELIFNEILIPKKVLDIEFFGSCPNCYKDFNSELMNEYDIQYCPWCGQKLDWTEN